MTRLDAHLHNPLAWLRGARAQSERTNPSPAVHIRTYGSIARYEELLGPLYRRNRSPTTAREANRTRRGE